MCEACDAPTTWTGGRITLPALKAEVIKLATEQPERKEVCYYTNYNQNGDPIKPGCIVGQAVYNLTGKFVDGDMEQQGCDSPLWRRALGVNLADNACEFPADLNFVRKVQSRQDYGSSWGEALAEARDTF